MIIRIVPLQGSEDDGVFRGKLLITFPGTPEETNVLARCLVGWLVEHLRFIYRDFSIAAGFIIAKRIPETPEESELIGDKEYWLNVSLQEVKPPRKFDKRVLELFPHSISLQRMLQQFNSAMRAENVVDSFLGFYKIIEGQYHLRGKSAKQALRQNEELRALISQELYMQHGKEARSMNSREFRAFINKITKIRDKCAHLREKEKFGYAPYDEEVMEIVRPSCDLLKALAHATIRGMYKQQAADLSESVFNAIEETLTVVEAEERL